MIYAVIWTAYTCAGYVGLPFGIKVQVASFPEASKPALAVIGLCRAEPRLEIYDPARRARAQARYHELPGADLQACRGTDCRTMVRRTTTLTFDEDPWRGK